MIRKLNILLVIGLAALLVWHRFSDELTPADRKLLFVGNSYIFFYDVPLQVRQLAASAPHPVRYHTRMIAKPSWQLNQHLDDGDVIDELNSGVWDVAIFQDRSSTTFSSGGRTRLAQSIAQLSTVAQQTNTDSLLYAHWPPDFIARPSRPDAIANIEAAYNSVATQNDAQVARIGAAWQRAWDAEITGLYHPDGHHASLKGAYLAALVVLDSLGDVDVRETTWFPKGLSQSEADMMRILAASR